MTTRRNSAAPHSRAALVVGDEQHAVLLPGWRGQDLRHYALEPRIASADGAIMGIVAHIRRNPGEVRDDACRQILCKLRKGHYLVAAHRVEPDVVVIDERVMFLHVFGLVVIAYETRAGHPFHI